jgi:hypothetical protein
MGSFWWKDHLKLFDTFLNILLNAKLVMVRLSGCGLIHGVRTFSEIVSLTFTHLLEARTFFIRKTSDTCLTEDIYEMFYLPLSYSC